MQYLSSQGQTNVTVVAPDFTLTTVPANSGTIQIAAPGQADTFHNGPEWLQRHDRLHSSIMFYFAGRQREQLQLQPSVDHGRG